MSVSNHGYNEDFYAWSLSTAEMIRQGRLSELDLEHVAEEIESMGKSDKRELISRFAVLLMHLLKWQFQPERRGGSWRRTIEEQRYEIIELLEDSPSLKYELSRKLDQAYQRAVHVAVAETEMKESTFPNVCPFTLEQCLNKQFFPD